MLAGKAIVMDGGTTTLGANVTADLGLTMAAACGTPALGPWIGQSMIKLWF